MEISEGVNTLGDLHNSSDDTKAYNYTSGVSLSTKECTELFQQFWNRRFVSSDALTTWKMQVTLNTSIAPFLMTFSVITPISATAWPLSSGPQLLE